MTENRTSFEEMEKDQERLAANYAPVLSFDSKEPFLPEKIGYTVFKESQKSRSSWKNIELGKRGRALCVEYAVFFSYDIQHLYDLEHIWVYLDTGGKVVDCEASFHGMYLNVWEAGGDLLQGSESVHLYAQPGKHAMMPDPKLFHLFWEEKECCRESAGKDGILNPGILKSFPSFTEKDAQDAEAYIRETYGFTPAGNYVPLGTEQELLLPWEKLKNEIPGRIAQELENIRRWAAAKKS